MSIDKEVTGNFEISVDNEIVYSKKNGDDKTDATAAIAAITEKL